MNKSRLHTIWVNMMARCYSQASNRYKNYGARGIVVCVAWHTFTAFYAWAIASGYRNDLTIERKNANGNYEPDNCQWIPRSDQARNTNANRKLTFQGETKILADWSRERNIDHSVLSARIDRLGWSVEKALTTPTRHITKSHKGGTRNGNANITR